MSKITRLSQINWGSDDIFRVSGVIDNPKARICYIDQVSAAKIKVTPVCIPDASIKISVQDFEKGLKTGSIKIMCVERV